MQTIYQLLWTKQGVYKNKALEASEVGALFTKGYRVIADFEGTRNKVTARYVVISRSVDRMGYETYKAMVLAKRKHEAHKKFQADLQARLEGVKPKKAKRAKEKLAYEDVPYSELPTVETYFEDEFTNLHA